VTDPNGTSSFIVVLTHQFSKPNPRCHNFLQVHKLTGQIIARYPTEKPFYTYHHVNAWEHTQESGAVLLHVDVIAYDTPIGVGGYDEFTLHKLRR
jgi:hypothetical protein